MRAMIDPNVQARLGQFLVGDLLPRLPDIAKLHLRSRQVLRQKPFVLALDPRLVGEPLRPDCPHRHHQMRMVIANVRFAMRRMDREIHRRAIAIGQPLRELPRRLQPLLGIQLVRQRDLEFPRDASVLAIFSLLRRIPQGRTIQSPLRIDPGRNHDLRMLDAAPPRKVMRQAIALVGQSLGGPIGRRRHGAAAGRAADRLHAEMVDRQIARSVFCSSYQALSCEATRKCALKTIFASLIPSFGVRLRRSSMPVRLYRKVLSCRDLTH